MRYVGQEKEFFTCYLGCGENVPYWEIVLDRYYGKPEAFFLSEGFSLDKDIFVRFISFLNGTSFGPREDVKKSGVLSREDFKKSFFYKQSYYAYYTLSNMRLRCPRCHRIYDGRTKNHGHFSYVLEESDLGDFGVLPINGRLFNIFTVVDLESLVINEEER